MKRISFGRFLQSVMTSWQGNVFCITGPWWGASAIGFPSQRPSNAESVAIMMTSSNGNIFRVTGPLCGEFTGPGEFPAQRPVTRSFDVFFDLRPNKRLSKQPWGWWFETPSWSSWRQCNDAMAMAPSLITYHSHHNENGLGERSDHAVHRGYNLKLQVNHMKWAGQLKIKHDDVIKWKHFRVTGPLCGEFTGHRWASDAELWCFLWSAPE